MNKMLKTLLLGVSLTAMVNTAGAMNQYVDPANVVQNRTDLMIGAENGDLTTMDPNQFGKQDLGGETAMMKCIKSGCKQMVEIVNTLKDREAGMQNRNGSSALMMALDCYYNIPFKDRVEIVKILKDKEAGLQTRSGETAMMQVLRVNQLSPAQKLELVKILADKEAGKQDNVGFTALFEVLRNNYLSPEQKLELVKILANKEALLKTKEGMSPLTLAEENLAILKARPPKAQDQATIAIFQEMVKILENAYF